MFSGPENAVEISGKRFILFQKMPNRMKSHLLWENFPFRTLVSEHILEKMPQHVHDDFYELVFVRDGKGYHQLEEEVYPIRAGNLFLIHPGVRHSYVNSKITIYNILFEPSFLNYFQQDMSGFPNYQLLFRTGGDLPARSRMLSVEPDSFPRMTALLDDIVSEEAKREQGSMTAILGDFLHLFLLICRHARPEESVENPHYAYRLSSLMAQLEERYAESWSLERMASQVRMSVSNFRLRFRELSGISPMEHLLRLRLDNASKLLRMEKITLSEIAFLCGFADSNYFSRQFKRKFGVSPRVFRKKWIGGENLGKRIGKL